MTPEEAMINLVETGLDRNDRSALRSLFEAVKATETRRCAEIFKRYVQACNAAWGPGASNPPKPSDYLNDILRTGGLEPEGSK